MEKTEAELAQEYKDAGVDVAELNSTEEKKEETTVVEKTEEVATEVTPKVETTVEKTEDNTLTDPKEKPRRSIYDEYKDKKTELKTEKELREQVEKERDELKEKLAAVETAKTPEQKQIATDDLDAFATEIGASPEALKRMKEIFTKDLQKTGLSEEDRKVIEEARKITEANSTVVQKQAFETEYEAVLPTLKTDYPNATAEELANVKKEVDRLSHTEKYHDKELDYVIYKEKEALSKLISPHKRGIEGKGKADANEIVTDFDPNADYSKMTPTEKAKWEEQYNKLGKTDGLVEDAQGRKLLV